VNNMSKSFVSALAFFALLCSGPPMLAQEQPKTVTPCDLAKNPKSYNGETVRVRGALSVEFEDFTFERRQGKVFVVMQFSEPYRQLYEEVIQPVTLEFGLNAYHVGEVFGPGVILHDIEQGIVEAEVVIAEITPENQNVFYELGYSHALNKPTILLADRTKKLPFDVSGYRVLFYDNTIAGKKQIEDGLRKHLEAILHE